MGTYIKNNCGGGCGPPVNVKRKSATLNLVGFAPFTCPDVPPPETITRYLQYQVNCSSATIGCGEGQTKKSASTTYNIDPFTGLQCVSGDLHVGCGCAYNPAVADSSCSATQMRTNCGPADGNNTVSLNLSQSYTIANVAANVDTLLGSVDLDDTATFPAENTDGEIICGTGGSVAVSWSVLAAEVCGTLSTLYYKSDYSVTKSTLKLSFLGPTTVKYFFTAQAGGAKTPAGEETWAAGDSVTVFAPSLPGTKSIEIISETHGNTLIPSTLSYVGTGTRNHKERNPPEGGGDPFTGFLAPDCKRYATKTVVSTYTYTNNSTAQSVNTTQHIYDTTNISESSSGSFVNTAIYSIDGASSISSGSGNKDYSAIVEFDDPLFPGEPSISSSESRVSNLSDTGELTTIRTITYYGYTDPPQTKTGPYLVPIASANCDKETSTAYSPPIPIYNSIAIISLSVVASTREVTGTTLTQKVEITDTGTYEANGVTRNTNNYSSTETIVTWSGELADTLTDENSTTTTWASNGQTCSWKTASSDGGSADSQSLSANFNVSVNAPVVAALDDEPSYKTYVHWFVVTDDSTNANCPTRQVAAHNQTHTTSSRGPFSVTDSESPAADLNQTHCITHTAVLTELATP